jgi:ABC-type oligopeptide transport system ATPase subunit
MHFQIITTLSVELDSKHVQKITISKHIMFNPTLIIIDYSISITRRSKEFFALLGQLLEF